MCETPGRNCWIQSFNNSFGRLMISGVQSSLLTAEQKTKKKEEEDKISASKQFTDSSMWLVFDKLHICTAPGTISVCDPHANPWVMMDSVNYCSPFTTSGIQKCKDLVVSQPRSTEPERKINVFRPCCSSPSSHTGWDTVRPLWAAWYVLEGTACWCN